MAAIRVSCKAIVIEHGRLLTIRCRKDGDEFHILPGGGQEHGETVHDALHREYAEEIGGRIEIGPLLFVRDYLGRRHEFAAFEQDIHQLEMMFHCTRLPGDEVGNGHDNDPYQIGVAWLPLAELDAHDFYPRALAPLLAAALPHQGATYLGDVN